MSVYTPGERVRKTPYLKGLLFRMFALLLIFGLLYASVWLGKGTVRHTADYGIQDACVKLYEAMKGFGTNETTIIEVISSHTAQERQRLKKKYQIKYQKDLVKELDSELSFSFSKLVLALMMDPSEFVLDCINKCICSVSGQGKTSRLFKRVSSIFKNGLRGNEYLLIGILCTKSNADLQAIKKAYKKKFGVVLEEKMAADGKRIPNDVCSFILDMIGGERDEELEVDEELLADDVQDLNSSKNEDALHQLLAERSFLHLNRVFDEFMNVSGKTIDSLVEEWEGEISDEMQGAYKAVISLIRDGEPGYWAERVQAAVEGAGTDDDTLIKVIVLRAEVDMLDIMEAYEQKFKIAMATEVGNDVSGDYGQLMLKILIKPPPEKNEKEDNQTTEDTDVTEKIIKLEKNSTVKSAAPSDNNNTEAAIEDVEKLVVAKKEIIVERARNQIETTQVEVIETNSEKTQEEIIETNSEVVPTPDEIKSVEENGNVTEESLEETIVDEVQEETAVSDLPGDDGTTADMPEEETIVEDVPKQAVPEDGEPEPTDEEVTEETTAAPVEVVEMEQESEEPINEDTTPAQEKKPELQDEEDTKNVTEKAAV